MGGAQLLPAHHSVIMSLHKAAILLKMRRTNTKYPALLSFVFATTVFSPSTLISKTNCPTVLLILSLCEQKENK
jgi:hypothetical protein